MGKLKIKEKNITVKDSSKYVEAEVSGGFKKLLERNLKYPKEAQNSGAQGIVYLYFCVSAKGDVEDLILGKSVNYFLDKESLRILKLSSGIWKPAFLNNIAVKSYHSQPINFVLDE